MSYPKNVVVSSWPAAGGTTLALMVANLVGLRYIYAGGVLKEWAARMGYDYKSSKFHKWEDKYGVIWDHFWEDYILAKLSASDGFLCEGKTLGFLLNPDKAFEVMVTATAEVRAQRSGKDGRTEDIHARDEFLSKRWYDLFGIELLNPEAITDNYNLRVDNSELSIAESLIMVLEAIQASGNPDWQKKLTASDYRNQAKEFEETFWTDQEHEKNGKDRLKNSLKEKKLYFTNDQIFADWKQNFSDKLSKLPEEMQAAVSWLISWLNYIL